MTRLWRALTRRGRWFALIGATTTAIAVVAGQQEILRFGVLLFVLPILSGVYVLRGKYHLASSRGLAPDRVQVDDSTTVVLRLTNKSRLPTGLVLLEDPVPWQLGLSPRFVLDQLGSDRSHTVKTDLHTTLRGRYTIGPLRIGVADPFGLCSATRTFTTTSLLTVVPRVVTLPRVALSSDWSGAGDSHLHALASSGADDVVPREYRVGDELRRVDWKSSARNDTLLVRREEQPLRTRAAVLVDTRRDSHRGEGPASSFEWAITAAASIALHLTHRGFEVRLLDLDANRLPGLPIGDVGSGQAHILLDALAQVEPSAARSVTPAGRDRTAATGLQVAIVGQCDHVAAARLAAARAGRGTSLAIVIDVAAWPGRSVRTGDRTAAQTAAVFSGAGWRAEIAVPATPLTDIWAGFGRGRDRLVGAR